MPKNKFTVYFLPFFLLATTYLYSPALFASTSFEKNIQIHSLSKKNSFSAKPSQDRGDDKNNALHSKIKEKIKAMQQKKATAATSPLPQLANNLKQIIKPQNKATHVQIIRNQSSGAIRQIRGKKLHKATKATGNKREKSIATARSFLNAYRNTLRINHPINEFKLKRLNEDSLQRQHVRFTQQYKNIPIWPTELIVHLDNNQNVELMDGHYLPTPRKQVTQPVVSKTAAIKIIKQNMSQHEISIISEPQLIIYAKNEKLLRLAWKITVEQSKTKKWAIIVDALSGNILDKISKIMHEAVSAKGLDIFDEQKEFNAWYENNRYYMIDTTKSMYDVNSTPLDRSMSNGAIYIEDAENLPNSDDPQSIPPTRIAHSLSSTRDWQKEAVSAAYNLSITYDYLKSRYNRGSVDGKGGSLRAIIRLGNNYANSFWDSQQNLMAFGDAEPYAAALDVVAHELFHGVTSHTANLIYQNQSGALSEAFSDIFGEAVEAFADGKADWIAGTVLDEGLRNLADPASVEICCGRYYPEKMSDFIAANDPFLSKFPNNDNGGVHINSSIINRAFFLLAEGLPNAIGIGHAEQIFYRALAYHLTSRSEFIDARLAALAAATTLYGEGSAQNQAVADAFDAVEIYGVETTPEPIPFPAIEGPDATLFVYYSQADNQYYLGRRENTLNDDETGVKLSPSAISTARPSVSGDGKIAVYVSNNNDSCMIYTDASSSEICLGMAGSIHSVAIGPSGEVFAFILLLRVSHACDTGSIGATFLL